MNIKGIKLSTAEAGICYANRPDVVLIELSEKATCAAVFTQNQFCAAPVVVAKKHLEATSPRYLIINSGNANAGTGNTGLQNTYEVCRYVGASTFTAMNQILPFSTGVIGQQLPVQPFIEAMTALKNDLSEDHWLAAAKAIMTTDTVPKLISKTIKTTLGAIKITGMSKGSGMICPNMATMLGFIATDAKIDNAALQQYLNQAVENSFNAISVDGDTSTNDACVLMASGQGIDLTDADDDIRAQFNTALTQLAYELAEAIIKDGEGATKLIKIKVEAAKDKAEAKEVAYTVAHSPLVKTALHASDANWGRILAAVGRAKIGDFDLNKIQIWLGDTKLIENGQPDPLYTEEKGTKAVSADEINILINMGRGDAEGQVLTCDLSCEYVKINAEYRT